MRFKVGDKVFLRSDSPYESQAGEFEVGEVVEIGKDFIYTYFVEWGESRKVYDYRKVDLKPAIIANKLNHKLYPSYIEKDGYLFRNIGEI